MRTHHEIVLAENQDIYTLTSREEMRFFDLLPVPVIDDYIVVLSPGGAIKKQISLFNLLHQELSSLNVIGIYSRIINPQDLFWKSLSARPSHRFLLPRVTSFDPFHANSISIINRDIPGLCERGDVLISMRALNLIAIVDLEKERVKWTWGSGYLQEQHEPTFLDNGHFLVFDNGTRRKYSRLIELDPLEQKIVWEYHAPDSRAFYSSWGGAAQRLGNGNTLITETSGGRAFEITTDGQTVWDFYNPDRQADGRRASIYRMTRITDPQLESVLIGNTNESGQ